MIEGAFRWMHVAVVAGLVAAQGGIAGAQSASGSPADAPPWQVWLGRTDALAQAAVTAEVCGFDRDAAGGSTDLSVFGIRSALIDATSAMWEWPPRVDAVVERFDAIVTERRRLEAVLALGAAADPYTRRTGLFATDGCSDAERERIAVLAAGTVAARGGDGGP